MRDRVTTALEIAGLSCISVAAFLTAPALGFLAVGVGLLLVGIFSGGSE